MLERNITYHFQNKEIMFPFKKKDKHILKELQPGEGAYADFSISSGQEPKEIMITYDDKYGNKYETRALVNFKERKIIKQEVKMVKKVKDISDNERPKVVIDEMTIFRDI